MIFNIYDATDDFTAVGLNSLTEEDAVELGLSGGEVRQSILDRCRADLNAGDLDYIQDSLAQFHYELSNRELIETPEGRAAILKEIDELLYELEDEALHETLWDFVNETVYIKEED